MAPNVRVGREMSRENFLRMTKRFKGNVSKEISHGKTLTKFRTGMQKAIEQGESQG